MIDLAAGGRPTHSIAAGVLRSVLPNGLTVLIKENHTAPVAALDVHVSAGYFHEEDRVSGIAHAIEHMLFKGTATRPQEDQIAREVRDLGGSLNAATYYEETYYYTVVPSQNIERAMEIQADAIQNSLFGSEELAREIEVIVQESEQKRDNPTAILIESLYALAFDRHRIRRWRMGSSETLRSFSRADLEQFVADHYRPENMVLSVVGDINPNTVMELAERFWGGVPRGEFARALSPEEPPRTTFRYARLRGEITQRLVMLRLPAPPALHPDGAALMIATAILSDGRSARLYRRLKEELRIASSAWSSYEPFEQMGNLTLGAECQIDDPLSVEQALWAEATRLGAEPVSTEELERVKTRIESRRLYAQEEVLGVARTLASYEALGDYRLADTLLAQLHAVSPADIMRVMRELLRLDHATLFEYLPNDLAVSERRGEEIQAALEGASYAAPEQTPAPIASTARVLAVSAVASREQAGAPKRLDLPGGATLYYRRRSDLPIVSITAMFRGGRRLETSAYSGITSLMVRSSMKGTSSYSAEEIANRIEGLGSGIGMTVAPEYMGYGLKIERERLAEGFAMLAEVLTSPAFRADEVEREKQSIYAEMRRQQDSSFSVAFDLFSATSFGSQPYGLPSSGMADAVAALTPAALRCWHSRHIAAGNLFIGIVGDLDESEAMALFSGLLPSGGVPEAPPVHALPFANRITVRPKQQTAAVIGFPGVSISDTDRYALDVLGEITSGMSGRFFKAVRGENALAYQVTGFHRSRRELGTFIAYTATAPENEERARDLILGECARLAREPVSDEELASARTAILGEHVIGTQTFAAQSGELAGAAIYALPPDEPQRYLARISQVTSDELMQAAARHLDPAGYWLGVARGGGACSGG